MSDDAWWPPPEDDPPERRAAAPRALLAALARGQDAVARLEASLEAASPDAAQGLRARLALHEAAGFLAWRRMSVHPHDLALREAGVTGSYSAALLTGRLARALPAGSAVGQAPAPDDWLPDDWLVDRALNFARLWRRLAERSTWQPLRDAAAMAKLLATLGEHAQDAAARADWLAGLRRRAGPVALLAAAELAAGGLGGAAAEAMSPGLGASFVAACLWRHLGFGRPVSLPFWSAPLAGIEAVAREAGVVACLDCVAEAALRARHDLVRLQATERRAAALPGTARSHLAAAAGYAVREPVVTGSRLAAGIGVSGRAGLDLLGRLLAAGLLREVTGRAAWRAFVVV